METRDDEYTSRSYLGLASWGYAEWRIDRVYVRKSASIEPVARLDGNLKKPDYSQTPAPTPTAEITTYEYDEYNKLTGITNPDLTTETMTYDDNGQLIRREKYAVGGGGFGDGNGEAGGGGSPVEVTEYRWNDQRMLVKVILPNGEPVEYGYDGNQRLISRKSSDGVDNFVQSGWDIMTKTDDVGKRTYYTGSSSIESGDSAKYFHYNHRGDTVLVTDSEGNILNNFSYEAYGKPTNSEGIPANNLSVKNIPNLFVGASGIRYDTKTNLHYMRFRWFSQEQMRFISPDLLMDLNRYAYVSGNPVIFIDPLGLADWGFMPADKRRKESDTIGRDISIIKKAFQKEVINVAADWWTDAYRNWETIGPYGSNNPYYWASGLKQVFNPYYWNDIIESENELGAAPGIDISTNWGGIVFVRHHYKTDIFVYPNCKLTGISNKPSLTINIIHIFKYSKENNKGVFYSGNASYGGINFNVFSGKDPKKDPSGFGIGATFGSDSGSGIDYNTNIQYFFTPEDIHCAVTQFVKDTKSKGREIFRIFTPSEEEFFNNFRF